MDTKDICCRMPIIDGNGIIFGRSGAGKSDVAKMQIADILENSQ